MYPKAIAGLILAFETGLPFFRRDAEGDLQLASIMFAAPVALHALSAGMGRWSDHTAAA